MNICNFDIFRRTEASPESVTPRLFKPPTHSSLIYCFSSIFVFPLRSGLATQFTYTAKLHSSILFICFSFLSVENSFYFVLESCCSSIFLFICRAMSSLYPQGSGFSPARNIPSPHLRNNSDVESQYLTELLTERQKLGPFMQILPICNRLLDQEILRVSGRISNRTFADYDRVQHCSPGPLASSDIMPDIGGKGIWNGNSWSCIQPERFGIPQGMSMDWQPAHGSPSSVLVKKRLRLEIPVDRYPTFNFVGRLLGPRGNSLKRVEASTGCRVFIRGKGSIKDPEKEESLRGKPGYEHLNDPLHILIEADLPANIIDGRLKQAKEIIEELLKPVDESQDLYKRQQLRELAMLNNIREESPQPRGSVSPFTSSGMKRAKISW